MSSFRESNRYRTRKMNDDKLLIKISAIDERTQIILDQQKYMRGEISKLQSKPSICTLHKEMEERIQKLRLSDARFSGELNILDLKAKLMIGGGVVFLSSIVSLLVSKFALIIF